MERRQPFAETTLETLRRLLASDPAGNRWFKVNLHVHGEGNAPSEVIERARTAELDLIAITDHQAFRFYEPIAGAARSPGRGLTVLAGIEITSVEGVHLLAIFPPTYSAEHQTRLLGWLEIPGSGDTRVASRRGVAEILDKVDEEGGVVVVPHPFTEDIGMLDKARKMSTKIDWLESGRVRLIQIPEDKIRYIERDDDGNWFNRYVLASSRAEDIRSSTYCLAPFNRSDAQRPADLADGCSWFRMEQVGVEGLKQVACEPRTRISRTRPRDLIQDRLLGMRVSGGYCDGQLFRFNEALNCIIGPNYAGKSAVFDFIRFALAQEDAVPDDSRRNLLTRLYGILGPEGTVELYLRQRGTAYVIRRVFNPRTVGQGRSLMVEGCYDLPAVYRFDPEGGQLIPADAFTFPVEVYEQGRIHRLRDDVGRQLEMLDEFANLAGLKAQRATVVAQLGESAERLAPLYDEREELKSGVVNLPQLEAELAEKVKYLPGEEEKQWAAATTFASELEGIVDELAAVALGIPDPEKREISHRRTELERLFGQKAPLLDTEGVAHSELLAAWREAVCTALAEIAKARTAVVGAVSNLNPASRAFKEKWEQEQAAHERRTSERLAKVGVESPKEIIKRVETLRKEIHGIKKKQQPRLAKINEDIDREQLLRENLLDHLEKLDREIAARREQKAQELTQSLEGQIKISVDLSADRTEYQRVLGELCSQITTREHKIQGREGQLDRIVGSISPIRLARALAERGVVRRDDGSTTTLQELCGITENTQNVVSRIADSVRLLNRLETVAAPDVPRIFVRRRGESAYADLRTGLSPGEQSAAVLTLALQTRTMPLILDQPEDELGYSYVVHLIVPKILQAKFSRQLLVVTHNANIPVLGDGDYVIKMENRPRNGGGRQCVVTEAGCFESRGVTAALLELEGGVQAFKFRQHRYTLLG